MNLWHGFYARFACFVLLTHFNISDQLGARFDEIKKNCLVRGVETFNSTKKKMGICFTVSNRCIFVTILDMNYNMWQEVNYNQMPVCAISNNCECFINQFDSSLSKNIHLSGKCLTVSSWCRHQTEGPLYIGKVPLRSFWNFALIHLHLMAHRSHLIQRRYVLLAHATPIDLFYYS